VNGVVVEFQPDVVAVQPTQLAGILVPILEILFAIAIALSFVGAIIDGAKTIWRAIHGK